VLSDGCSVVPSFEQAADEFENGMAKAGVTVTTAAEFVG
jgi:hypothetical protein